MTARAMLFALCLALVSRGAAAEAPLVTGIDLVSPHRLPEERVRAAIGLLPGRPRLRGEVRESIVRLWALGLFSEVRVEEMPEPGGVRLRYVLVRRPHVGAVDFRGDLEVDVGVVAETAGLAPGTGAEPARLEAARRRLLDLYEREGYLQARVTIESERHPATNAHDVVVTIEAGERARVGDVRVRGADRLSAEFVGKVFGLEATGSTRRPCRRAWRPSRRGTASGASSPRAPRSAACSTVHGTGCSSTSWWTRGSTRGSSSKGSARWTSAGSGSV
jgi:outer membrane protein assembly factor BamA